MKRTILFLTYLTFSCLCLIGIKDLCQKQTKGFALQKIISQNSSRKSLPSSLPQEGLASLRKILSQPYYFLKRGLQCYVFISEDKQYVLKFFRWKQIESPFWTHYVPDSWTKNLQERKEFQKKHDFASYQIAFEELSEETGTVFLHLSKTDFLHTSLCLFDPLHIRHFIQSDDVEFIVQKKADLFLPYFEEHKNSKEELRSFLSHLVTLLQKRAERRICDSDISFEYNMGVLEGKPILFDIGNLTKTTTSPSLHEFIQQESKLLFPWLKNNDPELAVFLENKIEEIGKMP